MEGSFAQFAYEHQWYKACRMVTHHFEILSWMYCGYVLLVVPTAMAFWNSDLATFHFPLPPSILLAAKDSGDPFRAFLEFLKQQDSSASSWSGHSLVTASGTKSILQDFGNSWDVVAIICFMAISRFCEPHFRYFFTMACSVAPSIQNSGLAWRLLVALSLPLITMVWSFMDGLNTMLQVYNEGSEILLCGESVQAKRKPQRRSGSSSFDSSMKNFHRAEQEFDEAMEKLQTYFFIYTLVSICLLYKP